MKALLVIFDGIGDLGETPLKKAKKPFIDKLARDGSLGILHPLGRGVKPGSDVSHLAILGYDPYRDYPGRGPLEALGAGIKLSKNDVAFRANFAFVENGIVKDRRAGRINTEHAKELAEKIKSIEIERHKIEFFSTVEHRGVVVVRDYKGDINVTSNDPKKNNTPLRYFEASDDKSKELAHILNLYAKEVHRRLKDERANYLLIRGVGRIKEVPPFDKRFGIKAAMIAGGALYKGVARYVGIDVLEVEGATGDKNSNYFNKFKKAVDISKSYDLVVVHLKATDSFGHDGDCKGKVAMIEKADAAMKENNIDENFSLIVITGDHSTPCQLKEHSGHGVPFLTYGRFVRKDNTKRFDEYECMKGGIGHIEGKDVMNIIINGINKNKKVGS